MINLTQRAARHIRRMIRKDGRDDAFVRLTVLSGGCSGMTYSFEIDTRLQPDDITAKRDGAVVAVDRLSNVFVRGATIDWHEGVTRSEFRIANPNARKSCGCGQSFETEGAVPSSEPNQRCDYRGPLRERVT